MKDKHQVGNWWLFGSLEHQVIGERRREPKDGECFWLLDEGKPITARRVGDYVHDEHGESALRDLDGRWWQHMDTPDVPAVLTSSEDFEDYVFIIVRTDQVYYAQSRVRLENELLVADVGAEKLIGRSETFFRIKHAKYKTIKAERTYDGRYTQLGACRVGEFHNHTAWDMPYSLMKEEVENGAWVDVSYATLAWECGTCGNKSRSSFLSAEKARTAGRNHIRATMNRETVQTEKAPDTFHRSDTSLAIVEVRNGQRTILERS